MQVNSSNGSLQQRIFSGTGSIGGVHLPDFNDKYVFSKKKSGISDEEYRKQIVAQAYKDFEKGTFQNKSDGFNKLMKNYTSEVSPDRKGIITSGLKAVSRNRHNVLKPIDFVATLLEGKVKYQKLPSGNSEYIEFYDKNGEMVATYSNNGSQTYYIHVNRGTCEGTMYFSLSMNERIKTGRGVFSFSGTASNPGNSF